MYFFTIAIKNQDIIFIVRIYRKSESEKNYNPFNMQPPITVVPRYIFVFPSENLHKTRTMVIEGGCTMCDFHNFGLIFMG